MTAVALLVALGALVGFAVSWRAGTAPPARPAEDAEREAARAQIHALDDAALMDPAVRADERARLGAELEAAPSAQSSAPAPAPSARLGTGAALAVALMVGLLAAGIYVQVQGPFWRSYGQAPAAASAAPEILAMVSRLETRLRTQGGSAQEWQRLARSYGVLGRIADAQQAYARAAELAPDDVLILDGYAALEAPPPPPPAIAALGARAQQAVDAAPNDPRAWARLGFARARLGDAPGARDAYARAYELDPRPELLAAYAAAEYALAPERPSARAVALYEQMLAQDPDAPVALWVLGLAAAQAGDGARAVPLLERLLALLPPDAPMRALVEETLRRARAMP